MQRYFVTNAKFNSDDIHHIIKVMRYKNGQQVEICEDQQVFLAKLIIDGDHISYQVIKPLDAPFTMNIDLFQGLPKGTKTEEIVKTATIFGYQNISFVPMVRSIGKIQNPEHKLARFGKIAKEAAELAKQVSIPKVSFFDNLKVIDWSTYDLVILLDEAEKVNTINAISINKDQKIAIIVGPEGGIDNTERYYLTTFATPISLGKTIYPTELAHLPIISVIYSRVIK